MKKPRYLSASGLDEALQALSEAGSKARILAGGTDLLVGMRRGALEPELVVDISKIAELRGIQKKNGHIVLGALTTHNQICRSPEMAAWAPVLVNACRVLGSLQIRNRGTIGGNLGNASPAGDTIPPLYVLEAAVHLRSLQGDRWVAVDRFFNEPGVSVCRPDELISAVRFRSFQDNERGFFLKIGQRRAVTIAKVSAAAVLQMDGKKVQDCRIALGAVAPTVIRLRAVEDALIGAVLSPEAIDQSAVTAGELCSPISDIRSNVEYRRRMAGVLVGRGLKSILREL